MAALSTDSGTAVEETGVSKKLFVVVSGVSSGIGRALAKEFHRKGHTVAGFSRRKDKIESLKRELAVSESSDTVSQFVALDICDDDGLDKWSAAVIKKFGAPNVVFHCAAIQPPLAAVHETEVKTALRTFDINALGYVRLVKCFLPAIKEKAASDDGFHSALLAMSSFHGKMGGDSLSSYCASKWALEGIMRSLAMEIKEDSPSGRVAAVCVSPGYVRTEMTASSFETSLCASFVPSADDWAKATVPWIAEYLLANTRRVNGLSLAPPIEAKVMRQYCATLGPMTGTRMDAAVYCHKSEV